jgi:hypothetical protein
VAVLSFSKHLVFVARSTSDLARPSPSALRLMRMGIVCDYWFGQCAKGTGGE